MSEAQEAMRALGGALLDSPGALELTLIRTLERPLSLLAWVEARAPKAVAKLVIKVPGARADADPRALQKSRRRYPEEELNARRLGGLFGETSGLSVVQPVACFPEIPALATVAVAGENLRDRITRGARWPVKPNNSAGLAEAMNRAGRWLGVLQERTIVPGALVSIEEMAAYADVRLKRLTTYGGRGLNEAARGRVLRAFERAARGADRLDRTVCGVHGDLALSNIVWGDSGITVIDVSAYREGSRYLDPTRVHHQLGLYRTKPLFTDDTIARLRDAFWSGYGSVPDKSDPMLLLHMIQHTLTHWLGRLKTAPTGPIESAYNVWVRRGHREALDRLTFDLEAMERPDARD
jgi:hypothetical protein